MVSKVRFGTTRYCYRFIQGKYCTSDTCWALHGYQESHEICQNINAAAVNLLHVSEAKQTIVRHLRYYAEKDLKQRNSSRKWRSNELATCFCGGRPYTFYLGSIESIIDNLIEEGLISAGRYARMIQSLMRARLPRSMSRFVPKCRDDVQDEVKEDGIGNQEAEERSTEEEERPTEEEEKPTEEEESLNSRVLQRLRYQFHVSRLSFVPYLLPNVRKV